MTELLDSVLSLSMWSAVEEEIQRKKDMLLRQMVYDNVTYEEYLRISGEVRGLDFTLKLKSRRISGV